MYQKHLCYHYTMGTPKVTAVYYTLCAGIFALKGLALKEVFRLGKWIRRAGGVVVSSGPPGGFAFRRCGFYFTSWSPVFPGVACDMRRE